MCHSNTLLLSLSTFPSVFHLSIWKTGRWCPKFVKIWQVHLIHTPLCQTLEKHNRFSFLFVPWILSLSRCPYLDSVLSFCPFHLSSFFFQNLISVFPLYRLILVWLFPYSNISAFLCNKGNHLRLKRKLYNSMDAIELMKVQARGMALTQQNGLFYQTLFLPDLKYGIHFFLRLKTCIFLNQYHWIIVKKFTFMNFTLKYYFYKLLNCV